MSDKRDDDITDLTADKSVEGTGKVKDKKKKDKGMGKLAPSRANAGEPGKKGRAKGDKKSGEVKRKFNLKLVLILIPIFLVVVFAALLVTNFFEARDKVGGIVKDPILDIVVWFDPEFRSVEEEQKTKFSKREEEFGKREKELEKREEDIAGREADLQSFKEALYERETLLERRSVSLDRREEQMNQTDDRATPIYRRVMSEQELADMQSLSRSYAQMDPSTAAGILANLKDEQYVAAILYYMAERSAAAILAVMEPVSAARITELLMQA